MTAATAPRFAEATVPVDTQRTLAPATIRLVDHRTTETQCECVDETPTAEANGSPCTHSRCASAPNFSSGHTRTDAQWINAAAEPHSAEGHGSVDTQAPRALGGFLRDPVLGVLADVVDDLENVRIANTNRVAQLTRTGVDKDGAERGFGLTLAHPEVAKLAVTVKALAEAEHDAVLNLQRALRKHPLARFQKRHKGIGEKQLARLLAVIGDPYWNDLHQRPRTVSELWAYCGLHVIRTSSSSHSTPDAQLGSAAAGTPPHAGGHTTAEAQSVSAPGVAPKRQRGQRSNWNEAARKRVWVIASAMPKFPGGQYEQVYRDARAKYADAVHAVDCVRCGPAGKPAIAGSALSDGHKHARAIRITAKEILKDLWVDSRDLYTSSLPASGGEEAGPERTSGPASQLPS